MMPEGEVTDVFVPLMHDGKYLGVLLIGINPNPTVVASSNIDQRCHDCSFYLNLGNGNFRGGI